MAYPSKSLAVIGLGRNATNEELIKEAQALSEELGRTPKRREFKRNQAAKYRFGSWNNFIKAAGLIPLKEFNLTIEHYEGTIHDFVNQHGYTPTKKDFDDDTYSPDARTIERKLNKTWNEILISLGYETNIRMNDFSNVTDKEILAIVKSELERIGSTKLVDYRGSRSENAPSVRFLRDRLDMKWNEVLELLDLEVNVEHRTKDEWLQLLKDAAEDSRKTPSIPDLGNYKLSDSTYKFHFGSYNNAIKAAGLEPNAILTEVMETDEELFVMYVGLSRRLGRAATSKDIDLNLPYSYDVFAIRFGGINNLKRLAGYEASDFYKKFTKEKITKILEQAHATYGILSNTEMSILSKENDEFPSISTICRYFATTKMSIVWESVKNKKTI